MSTVSSIRDALPITGRTIVEITTDDWDEIKEKYPHIEERQSRIYLHFDDGSTASFCIGEGDKAFSYDNFPDGHPFLNEKI
jgi:hypothetical protein